jgi:hypothetical protein
MLRVRTRPEFLKTSFGLAAGMGMLAAVSASDVLAQPALQAPPAMVLFQNMRIFDGKGRALSAPSKVLVCGTKIERISTQPIPVARSPDTIIIDAGGLIPGLIDVHVHLTLTPCRSLCWDPPTPITCRFAQPWRRRTFCARAIHQHAT